MSLTEVALGLAATKTSGEIQIALTVFFCAFPSLIAAAFFTILWRKPWVLYPPKDYPASGPGAFVDAMRDQPSSGTTSPLTLNARTEEGGAPAVAAPPPAVAAPENPPPSLAHRVDLKLAELNDPYWVERDESLARELAGQGFDLDPSQTVRLLRRYVGGWYAVAEFERAYGPIFGSQISLVREANAVPLPLTRVRAHFDEVVAPVLDKAGIPVDFDAWLRFPESQGLIERDGDTVRITTKGRSFLIFIAKTGRPDRAF